MTQVTDPAVSRRKFDREVSQLRAIESTLVSRGFWIMSAEFPFVKVAFATANLKPRFIPFAVKVDFTDYDAQPLSISFVDPFDDHELLASEMIVPLKRHVPFGPEVSIEISTQLGQQLVSLYQSYPQRPDLPGFLCLPGTRAYHSHSAHSGDPWELHRATGEGSLFSLLNTIWCYGTAPIDRLSFQIGQIALSLDQSAVPS